MRWQSCASVNLKAPNGDTLGIILETNGQSWKLFARFKKLGLSSVDSNPEWYPTIRQGKEAHAAKVAEAKAQGWEE